MPPTPPNRSARRRRRATGTVGLAALVVLATAAGCRVLPTAASAAPPGAARTSAHPSPTTTARAPEGSPDRPPRDRDRRELGVAGGALPDGATVLDDQYPGVARLDPALRDALREAARDAGRDGVELALNSGWRSRAYQARLLDEAVAEYGSRAAATRWVATPSTSPHVAGDAVDLSGADGIAWVARHGAAYGLCRVYANEPWHVELRAGAATHGCPAPYADPTHDPRMQG
jgi:hypothetical protein